MKQYETQACYGVDLAFVFIDDCAKEGYELKSFTCVPASDDEAALFCVVMEREVVGALSSASK